MLGFAALAIAFSARGAVSLSMPAWHTQFGWSRSFSSSAASLAMLVMAVVAPFAGNAVDRYGPRILLFVGLMVVGLSMLSVTSITDGKQTWMLIAGFSMAGGVGFGIIAQHVVASAIATRVTERRGLATGIGTSGSTAGQIIVLPLLAATMATASWRVGFMALSLASFALCPLVLLLVKPLSRPQPHAADTRSPHDSLAERLMSMARSKSYNLLFWSYLICGFTTSGIVETHFLPFANSCGFGPVSGATAFGVLSAVNLVGMIAAGWLSDKVDRSMLLGAIYVARALSFVFLLFIDLSYPRLLMFAVFFGAVDYSTVPITAGLLARTGGARTLGLSMGVLSAGHAIGGALGALAGGVFFDLTGRFDVVWYVSAALAALAAVMAFSVREKAVALQPA